MRLPFQELMQWCNKRQKYLEWNNQVLAYRCSVPIGTISRIKAGDYIDCKYSTIRNIVITLVGGTTDEWPCNAQVEKELQQVEELEQQAAKVRAMEKENEMLKARLDSIDEQHRKDIRAIKEEYQEQKQELKEQIAFLKEQLKAWQSR
jgi:predicted transcriptional regulator